MSLLYLSAKFLRCFKKFLHFRMWRSKCLPSGKAACMHNKAHMWQTTDWPGLRHKKRCKGGQRAKDAQNCPDDILTDFPYEEDSVLSIREEGKVELRKMWWWWWGHLPPLLWNHWHHHKGLLLLSRRTPIILNTLLWITFHAYSHKVLIITLQFFLVALFCVTPVYFFIGTM